MIVYTLLLFFNNSSQSLHFKTLKECEFAHKQVIGVVNNLGCFRTIK